MVHTDVPPVTMLSVECGDRQTVGCVDFSRNSVSTILGRAGTAKQGLCEMRKFYTAGLRTAAALMAASALAGGPVLAQEMSKESVETLMEYAWAITPDRFTKPNGVTVEIDRNNRKAVEVPIETAREVIKTGRLSAHAQVCDLKEEHTNNYRTMMAREAIKRKWSEQQMVYINQ